MLGLQEALPQPPHHPALLKALAKELQCEPADIVDFELNVCDTVPGTIGGGLPLHGTGISIHTPTWSEPSQADHEFYLSEVLQPQALACVCVMQRSQQVRPAAQGLKRSSYLWAAWTIWG